MSNDLETTIFAAATNLSLCVAVSGYGIYWWLKPPPKRELAFRDLAYKCWWLSWIVWVFAWSIILLKVRRSGLTLSLRYDVPTLACDNLNSVFLLLTYFAITRGTEYTPQRAMRDGILLCISIVAACLPLYLLFYGLHFPVFAYRLHAMWSLSLAVLTPVLVGWAFQLRFNTRIVLLVGLAYGFIQPAVYATALPVGPTTNQEGFDAFLAAIRPVIDMLLALLKVAWAIVCTRVLSVAYAPHESLIDQKAKARRPLKFWGKWGYGVRGHATLLVAVYLACLIGLAAKMLRYALVQHVITAAGAVLILLGLIDYVWKFWERRR
jgi:hypothetical protein